MKEKIANFEKPRSSGRERIEFGDLGEELAVALLEKKGYHILARKYKRKTGEIDIIAETGDKRTLVFAEVKARHTLKYGIPAEAVTSGKIRRIKRTASLYMVEGMKLDRISCYSDIRFDVMEVVVVGSTAEAHHIEGAF